MKTILVFFVILFFHFSSKAQDFTQNIGLDTSNIERTEIINLWTNYLKSNPDEINNSPYWSEKDKTKYKSYDLLKSEGFISPSLYYFQLNNKILSITKLKDDYLIKSMFYEPENFNIYAITNVLARKEKGKYFLTNYQPILTSNWKTKTIGSITYHYFPDYKFNKNAAKEANNYLKKICKAFNLKIEPINYFICNDCEDVSKIKGFDYVLSMGNGTECAFFDKYNNIIYATQLAGENHQHELTHYINKSFLNANDFLLTGLSAYWGGENAHKAKPLIHSIKRVNNYLKLHPEIDLNKVTEFWKMDEETNPQYVTSAIICHLAILKGGLPLLKKFLDCGNNDEDLLSFIENHLDIKKEQLNKVLRKKIDEIAQQNIFKISLI